MTTMLLGTLWVEISSQLCSWDPQPPVHRSGECLFPPLKSLPGKHSSQNDRPLRHKVAHYKDKVPPDDGLLASHLSPAVPTCGEWRRDPGISWLSAG